MQQLKYKFYATILDSFWGYLNSDVVWENTGGGLKIHPTHPNSFTSCSFKNSLIALIVNLSIAKLRIKGQRLTNWWMLL